MRRATVYLAGAMTHADEYARVWRREAEERLGPQHEVLDPYAFEIGTNTTREIVAADYSAILRSTHVLAYVGEPSWGTAMELMFARQVHVPSICFGVRDGAQMSPWLRHYGVVFYASLRDAVGHILRDARRED